MAKKQIPPAAAPTENAETLGERVARTLAEVRAVRIREAYARTPRPSYDQIAVEVGCTARTVYNVVHGITHGG